MLYVRLLIINTTKLHPKSRKPWSFSQLFTSDVTSEVYFHWVFLLVAHQNDPKHTPKKPWNATFSFQKKNNKKTRCMVGTWIILGDLLGCRWRLNTTLKMLLYVMHGKCWVERTEMKAPVASPVPMGQWCFFLWKDTPLKINDWNLKITELKRDIIFQTLDFFWVPS